MFSFVALYAQILHKHHTTYKSNRTIKFQRFRKLLFLLCNLWLILQCLEGTETVRVPFKKIYENFDSRTISCHVMQSTKYSTFSRLIFERISTIPYVCKVIETNSISKSNSFYNIEGDAINNRICS